MCLTIDSTITKPRRGNIRYKFLLRRSDGQLSSPSQSFIWWRGQFNHAIFSGVSNVFSDPSQTGFHVFTNRRDAERASRNWVVDCYEQPTSPLPTWVIVKLKVKNFKCAGTIMGCDPHSNGKYGEIWIEAKILEVRPIRSRLHL